MSSFRHLLLQLINNADNDNDTTNEILPYSAQSIVEFVDNAEELEKQYPYLMILNRSSDVSTIVPIVFISTVPQYVLSNNNNVMQVIPKECLLYGTGQKIYNTSLAGLGGSDSLGVADGYMYYNYGVERPDNRFLWCNYDLYYWEGTVPSTKLYRQKG